MRDAGDECMCNYLEKHNAVKKSLSHLIDTTVNSVCVQRYVIYWNSSIVFFSSCICSYGWSTDRDFLWINWIFVLKCFSTVSTLTTFWSWLLWKLNFPVLFSFNCERSLLIRHEFPNSFRFAFFEWNEPKFSEIETEEGKQCKFLSWWLLLIHSLRLMEYGYQTKSIQPESKLNQYQEHNRTIACQLIWNEYRTIIAIKVCCQLSMISRGEGTKLIKYYINR